MRRTQDQRQFGPQTYAPRTKSPLLTEISNRHTPKLNSPVSYSKQTTAPESNRHKLRGVHFVIFFAFSSPSPHSDIILSSDFPSCLAL
jgi:hypothetical protein